jgi:4-methylaminobutanoate oxidase (formaldehyde-forming)
MLYHNEPVWRDGVLVGRLTSGMFGHTLGKPLGLGYVRDASRPVTADFISSGRFEVEVAGERVPAEASLAPLYDPRSLRVKEA